MKKICWLILSCSLLPLLHAQYTLSVFSPPPQFTHDDLWNLSITRANTGDNYAQFYLAMRIFNTGGQLQTKTNSTTLALNDPLTVINIASIGQVQPFTYNYYNNSLLQQVIASGGLFPPGDYAVIFTLYGRPSDGEYTELAEDNYSIAVDAMWPPMLLSPADGDSIQTPNPVLTWTPAFSTYAPGNITYTLKVVPLLTGQSKQQAISANLPVYTGQGIPMPLQIYPNSAQPLDSNKRYAWQVQGFAGTGSLGYSEVWEFCYCFRTRSAPHTPGFYYKLNDHPQSQFEQVKGNWLPVAFPEQYVPIDNRLHFRIRNLKGNVLADDNDFEAGRRIGLNKYEIYLCSSSGLDLPDGKYLLEFYAEKQKTYYLRIQLSDRTECP